MNVGVFFPMGQNLKYSLGKYFLFNVQATSWRALSETGYSYRIDHCKSKQCSKCLGAS